MYHPDVIAARLRHFAHVVATLPDGVLPWYSIEESQSRTASLLAAYDDDGQKLRQLTQDEEVFVGATRIRCACDFRYFGERFVFIDEEGHGLRPLYPLWESQEQCLRQLAALERKRVAEQHPDGLLVNVLKARQLGISTLAEALVAHRIFTRIHIRALSGADVEDQAGYLFRMVGRIYDQLPPFLKPARLTHVKNREMSFGNECYLKTAWGKSTRGALASVGGEGTKGAIGRGQTYSAVHISELATWDNPEQLDSALFPAIPVHSDTLVLLESTAEHAQDWWHLQWLATAEGFGRFTNIFIPWYTEPKKYSLPAPAGWEPSSKTLEHAAKCQRDSSRWLGEERSLSHAQLYWYETTRAAYEKKGELHKFLKEYPADDQECFQYAGRAIFTFEQLDAIDAAGSRRGIRDIWRVEPAREIAALRRDRTADDPLPIRGDRPAAPLAPRVPRAWGPLAADQFPIPPGYGFERLTASELKDQPNLRGGLLTIWEYPRSRGKRQYVLGVDVGDGLGQDYSICSVIRLPTIDEPAEEVAQFCSNRHDTKAFSYVCDAIGRLYPDADGIEALAAIEVNNHGLAVQDMLQLHLGYSNFYLWEYADAASPEKRYSTRIGWLTTPRTRPLLLAAFHSAITTIDPITHTPDFVLNSPITRGELRHFITEGTIGEAEAARGQHDDAIMSSAIGYYVAWRMAGGEMEPIEERRKRKAQAQRDAVGKAAAATRDWRNSGMTAEEAHAQEDPDDADYDSDGEDATGGPAGLSFFDDRDRA